MNDCISPFTVASLREEADKIIINPLFKKSAFQRDIFWKFNFLILVLVIMLQKLGILIIHLFFVVPNLNTLRMFWYFKTCIHIALFYYWDRWIWKLIFWILIISIQKVLHIDMHSFCSLEAHIFKFLKVVFTWVLRLILFIILGRHDLDKSWLYVCALHGILDNIIWLWSILLLFYR